MAILPANDCAKGWRTSSAESKPWAISGKPGIEEQNKWTGSSPS